MTLKEFVKIFLEKNKGFKYTTQTDADGYCRVILFNFTTTIKLSSSDSKKFAANVYHIDANSASLHLVVQIIEILKKGGYED